jgi:hypothetical protein
MLCELVQVAQGISSINPMINKYPFALLAAVAVDISVDAMHALKGHVEEFCVQLLDSRTRELPERSNTESGEQHWVDLVRMTRSLNYTNRGMHEFWKLTHYMLKNRWRLEKTYAELKREPKKKVKPSVYWVNGKPYTKHQYRSMNVQSKKNKKEKKIKPAKLLSTRTNSRRLPLTAAVKNAMPRGFDTRLLALTDDGARRKHTHFQVKWFEDNYSELMDEVKRRLDLTFAPSMDAKFATKAYLHQWLV